MFDLPTILKPNATEHDRALEQAIRKGRPDLTPIATLMNPDTCPAHLLGWLAWSLSVDVWEPAWSETTKRSVLSASLEVHRKKGTVGSVRRALEGISVPATIIEWWEEVAQPGAEPSTFEIWLDLAALLLDGADIEATLAQLREVVDAAKPVSAHYTAHARVAPKATEFAGCTSIMSGRVYNRAGIPDAPIIAAAFNSGALSRAAGHLQTPTLGAPS